MSWRDEEFTDTERGLSAEVKRLRSVVRELEAENEVLRSKNAMVVIGMIINSLPDYSEGEIWSDGDGEILVRTESAASAIAILIESLCKAQGEEADVNTGYYDPEEDKRNNEEDQYMGWWYVNIN